MARQFALSTRWSLFSRQNNFGAPSTLPRGQTLSTHGQRTDGHRPSPTTRSLYVTTWSQSATMMTDTDDTISYHMYRRRRAACPVPSINLPPMQQATPHPHRRRRVKSDKCCRLPPRRRCRCNNHVVVFVAVGRRRRRRRRHHHRRLGLNATIKSAPYRCRRH